MSRTLRNLLLQEPPKNKLNTKRKRDGDNLETTIITESYHPSASKALPNLHDILFPKYVVKNIGYGIHFEDWAAANSAGKTVISTNQTIVSSVQNRSTAWTDSRQKWLTFVHMPLHNLNSESTTYSIFDLQSKAKQISNFAYLQTEPVMSTTENEQTKYNHKFIYERGYTKHTFVNQGLTDVFLRTYLSSPRTFLPSTNDGLQNLPVAESLRQQMQNQMPLGTDSGAITHDSSKVNESNDLAFKMQSTDSQRNYNWTTIQSKLLKIDPGDKIDIIVNHPSFSFSESDFNTFLSVRGFTQGTETGTTVTNPCYAPFSTVILDVQLYSELGRDISVNNHVNATRGEVLHTQEQYHCCRAVPWVKENVVLVQDTRTAYSNTVYVDRTVNEDQQIYQTY